MAESRFTRSPGAFADFIKERREKRGPAESVTARPKSPPLPPARGRPVLGGMRTPPSADVGEQVSPSVGPPPGAAAGQRPPGLPPGLASMPQLPPGLAGRPSLPPGLAAMMAGGPGGGPGGPPPGMPPPGMGPPPGMAGPPGGPPGLGGGGPPGLGGGPPPGLAQAMASMPPEVQQRLVAALGRRMGLGPPGAGGPPGMPPGMPPPGV